MHPIFTNILKGMKQPTKEDILKMNKCLKRFDNAYKEVSDILPETTIDTLFHQLSDQTLSKGVK